MGRFDEHESSLNSHSPLSTMMDNATPFSFNFGGLLGCLSGLIEKLSELAAASEELSKTGDLRNAASRIHGVYGINVRPGRDEFGRPEVKVEPFGNVYRDICFTPLSEDVREPLFDIGEVNGHVIVTLETPGADRETVRINVIDGRFDFSAKYGKTTYRKDFDLPDYCDPNKMSWECHNGIVKVMFESR